MASEKNRRVTAAVVLVSAIVASGVSSYYGAQYGHQSTVVLQTDEAVSNKGLVSDIFDLQQAMADLQSKLLESGELSDGQSEESEAEEGETVVLTLDNVQEEFDDLSKQVAALEKRILAEEADTAEVKEVSELELAGPQNPSRDYLLPGKMIEFRGRTLYTMTFEIRINNYDGHWRNIFHLGDTGSMRSPAIWTWPSRRQLHIRQRGEYKGGSHWNWGCDPAISVTPATNQWFKVDIFAKADRFEIQYNGQNVCGSNQGVLPPAGQQRFYFSDPWSYAAMVTVKNVKFAIQ